MDEAPVWQELRNDARDGAMWVDWYCEPPAEGAAYEVVREDSDGYRLGHPVRRIFEVRPLGPCDTADIPPIVQPGSVIEIRDPG